MRFNFNMINIKLKVFYLHHIILFVIHSTTSLMTELSKFHVSDELNKPIPSSDYTIYEKHKTIVEEPYQNKNSDRGIKSHWLRELLASK